MTTIAEKIPYEISSHINNRTGNEFKVIAPSKENQFNEELVEFLSRYISLSNQTSKIIRTNILEDLNSFYKNGIQSIINLSRMNDVRYVHQFLREMNSKLSIGGIYVGCVETNQERIQKVKNKLPKVFHYPTLFLQFLVMRCFPKWSFTKKMFFTITKGKNRYLSLSETLGRLAACGFETIEYKEINNMSYFVTKKISEPIINTTPSYGPLLKLNRFGKYEKPFRIYKFRTMHPYSEFLQSYVYKKNNLQKGGKFKDDFRIPLWGKLLRKYWIDEIPMFLNLLKGDIKLVGVRPLSAHYLSLYRNDLRKLRYNHKPGLIPPFYADLPETIEEIMDSEERYLKAYDKNPIKTDLVYFFRIFKNIFFNNARSN